MVSRDLKNKLNGFFHMMNLAVERREKDEIIADFSEWLNNNYVLINNDDESALDERKKSLDKFVENAELNDLVDMVVAKEYKRAVEKYGDKYNSYHEASAILKEELEEVAWETDFINFHYNSLWKSVKEEDVKETEEVLDKFKTCVNKAIVELAQVRVVLEKMSNMGVE